MSKHLYIAEKPSVAREFAKSLGISGSNKDGYIESDDSIVTWCVGHLVTMSYPEKYDISLKRWSLETLPFIPAQFKYEVIENVKKQFDIVAGLLKRDDVDTIYVCTDSGREGEYIYRLVEQEAHVTGKNRKRVWIDSQTEEEIKRGIREAKDLSEYDNLSAAAYLRAKEDYLMGINFSRLLTLKFGPVISSYMHRDRTVLSIGRVMTCVLGMVVRREREIRDFVKTTFYKVNANVSLTEGGFSGEWKVDEKSSFYAFPGLYKDNGFLKEEDAKELINRLSAHEPLTGTVTSIERKTEKKNAPLLYNLAEIQNDCSRRFKISPDQTLQIIQELYEKKLVTYPRTDARVLSTAVAKEIDKNIRGIAQFTPMAEYANEVLSSGSYHGIEKTKYTNDKLITDHYAIIPTGQGLGNYNSLSGTAKGVYEMICRRFLSIFYPAAEYKKYSVCVEMPSTEGKVEHFYANFKALSKEGYLKVAGIPQGQSKKDKEEEVQDIKNSPQMLKQLEELKKGAVLNISGFDIKEGSTSPPNRYNSGSIILAMENAGQFIEDEELRALIKGSGIGTSATRAEILKKLVNIKYLNLNTKTQIITPTYLGELVYEVVLASMPKMLDAEMTASWEKGLGYVADGKITSDEYMQKLSKFIAVRCTGVKGITNPHGITSRFAGVSQYYRK
ncbi:MAG: type IA DNA topoisomerase [Lachnospiraceae bacterium]|nr:type IA DNA topoisomerase [Lachnospiraceae bacterium]